MNTSDVLRAVDLFCGAGGLSWGLVEALERVAVDADEPTEAMLAEAIDLVGVNHWETAIQTHERNHPWARQIHDDVQHVDPAGVFDAAEPDVAVLSGGIECTHWSSARGGKPVDEQKRMPAWDVLTWIQKLRPDCVLFENVREFKSWGPIDEDGQPTRTGETFEAWTDAIHSLGYSVDWRVLNAADYGDATTRKRLFVVGRREGRPDFPELTHAEDGAGDTKPWRPAAEIIDWSDRGDSIWTRSRPLSATTMRRIAEGIRRHCDERLADYADVVENLTPEDVEALQDDVVQADEIEDALEARDEPFLVRAPAVAADGGEPDEESASMVMGQHSGAVARDADADPVPTVASKGAIHLIHADAYVLPRNGPQRGDHSNPAYGPEERPLHTVTAKNHDGHLVTPILTRYSHSGAVLDVEDPLPTVTTARCGDFAVGSPFLVEYYGNSDCAAVDDPLPTVPAGDHHALCVPELSPWGLGLQYRMLQPRELAAAQGFPEDYDFAGTKTETTEQIGNAVPVNLARELVSALLESRSPALTDYLDGAGVAESGGSVGGVPGDD